MPKSQKPKLPQKSKDLCTGCKDAYYNEGNNSNTGECWMFEKAEVINAYRIGWWTPQDKKENFEKVTILSCRAEPGRFAYYQEIPKHLR
jgi:hypothetical protein